MSKNSSRESQCRIKYTILKGATVLSIQQVWELQHNKQTHSGVKTHTAINGLTQLQVGLLLFPRVSVQTVVYSVQRGQHLIHMEQIKQVLEKNKRHRNYLLFVIRHTREFCKLGSANVHICVRSQTASSCESAQWQFIHCQSGELAGNFGLLMFEMVL